VKLALATGARAAHLGTPLRNALSTAFPNGLFLIPPIPPRLPNRGDSLRGPSLGETFSCMLYDVERNRRDDERQEQRQALAADDDHRDGPAFFGARTAADGQRQHASDEGESCHQDGTEAVPARLEDGRAERHPLGQQIPRVVDLEDCVLRYNPEQDQHAERRVQVQRIR
jgi:hypothetical protein